VRAHQASSLRQAEYMFSVSLRPWAASNSHFPNVILTAFLSYYTVFIHRGTAIDDRKGGLNPSYTGMDIKNTEQNSLLVSLFDLYEALMRQYALVLE
jgi:hypothetical protein